MIKNLEALLAKGLDNAGLRFALATRYLADDKPAEALEHAKVALEFDPAYSAAWRVCGQAQVALGLNDEAMATYEQGIAVAEKRGDEQAARQMRVFARRLDRSAT